MLQLSTSAQPLLIRTKHFWTHKKQKEKEQNICTTLKKTFASLFTLLLGPWVGPMVFS